MIKILSAEQTRQADQFTIRNEPIDSIDLMERAASAFVKRFTELVHENRSIDIVCGPGNNGGDAFAIARLLSVLNFKVSCYEVPAMKLSPDCHQNRERFLEMGGQVLDFGANSKFQGDLIIDGVFGSGLNRVVSNGPLADLIESINSSGKSVISIDIPSGLFADSLEYDKVVRADHTLTFQAPKLSFLLPETGNFPGAIHVVDIGLDRTFIEKADSGHFYLNKETISPLLKKRSKFSHKGVYGRVQIIAGSHGKMGAAHLCGQACMRMGAGLLTMNVPASGLEIIQTSLPEAMALTSGDESIAEIEILDNTDVFCLGPGIGTSFETRKAIRNFLKQPPVANLVLDADALNCVALDELIELLPAATVITPHPGEFDRLFGSNENSLKKLDALSSFSKKTGVVVVSKGAHTVISDEDGKLFFNSSGNPGMATAGSGDVLAGMIAGLLAQGLNSRDAAIAGVYLHGLAGDIALKKIGEMSLMASDLLNKLPEAITNAKNKDFI